MAVSLARVNSELGVTGTFFILLPGHSYNPLSATSFERVSELVLLGQRLGLHVAGQKEDQIAADFEYLSSQFPLDPVFSWHNPSPEVLAKYRDQEGVDGLTNVYSTRFLHHPLYLSHSNSPTTFTE